MTNEGQGSVPTPQHAHGFPTQQTNRVRVQIITSPSLAHTLASGCSQKLPACVPSSIFPVKYANKMCSCAFNKDYVACRLACCSAYEAHRKDNPLTKIRGLTTHSALENRRPLRLVAGTLLLFWWALSVCQFGGHWHCWRFAGGSRKGNQIFRYHHFFPDRPCPLSRPLLQTRMVALVRGNTRAHDDRSDVYVKPDLSNGKNRAISSSPPVLECQPTGTASDVNVLTPSLASPASPCSPAKSREMCQGAVRIYQTYRRCQE